MKALTVNEALVNFTRTGSSKKGLDVGEFRNQIDWDNLPEEGLFRVLSGNENHMDECFVWVKPSGEIYMIKNWEDNGGEWARGWPYRGGGSLEDYDSLIPGLTFYGFLKENGAFKIIHFYPVNIGKFPPSWEGIAPFGKTNESFEFKRTGDSKRSLGVGYYNQMPEYIKDYDHELGHSQTLQWNVELANHPSDPGNKVQGYDLPVFSFYAGLEPGYGLPDEDNRVFSINVFIDPVKLKAYGEISGTDLASEEDDTYHRTEWEDIDDDSPTTVARVIYKISQGLLDKVGVEI